ncbi:MAG: DUF4380 domain-containing protein [Prevotella sp.]|nr:DUF4380 domain-containing protein [Prevotella sp.]
MKHLCLTLLLVGAASTVGAVTDEQLLTLRSGDVTMTVDVARGGRITSLKYQEREALSQSSYPHAMGSTFWTSPQSEWSWPPVAAFDSKPYRVVANNGSSFTIESEVAERIPLRVGKTFSVDDNSGAFVVTYTIRNEGSSERRVAPWEITRVRNDGGTIFFEARGDSVWPAGLMAFERRYGALWYKTDQAEKNRKVNADGRGWLAFSDNGLLLVKRFPDLKDSEPAPSEAEVQVYVNVGRTYIELESQGAYTLLQPGEQLSWTVRWNLLSLGQGSEQPEALLSCVRQLIGKP